MHFDRMNNAQEGPKQRRLIRYCVPGKMAQTSASTSKKCSDCFIQQRGYISSVKLEFWTHSGDNGEELHYLFQSIPYTKTTFRQGTKTSFQLTKSFILLVMLLI